MEFDEEDDFNLSHLFDLTNIIGDNADFSDG